MGFQTIDFVIVILYLIASIGIGMWVGRGVKSTADYFAGAKSLPWWSICISIVATETSALTFLSIPGLAFIGDFSFLQIALGYIIGRLIIAKFLLPHYFNGELVTAYQWIGQKFGTGAQKTTSVIFLGTRLFGDGVRLYATAIPIAILMKVYLYENFNITGDHEIYFFSIVILGIITILYTVFGGIKAVIWSDVLQWLIYLFGAFFALYVISEKVVLPDMNFIKDKLTVFHFTANNGSFYSLSDTYLSWNSIIGGMVLSMASHGTDQLLVQRILCSKNLKDGQRAMVFSGFIVFLQFTLFLTIGFFLSVYYDGKSVLQDQAFSKFIIEEIPSGLSGFVIAAIIAAAMSTLSSSVNSLASSSIVDILKGKFQNVSQLFLSKAVSILWGVLLTVTALLLIYSGDLLKKSVVELGLKIASVTYGPILGIFIVGMLDWKILWKNMVIALIITLLAMAYLVFQTTVTWTLFTLIGSVLFLILIKFQKIVVKE